VRRGRPQLRSDEIFGDEDCYVAFFGERFPPGEVPERIPYVLRYAASSLERAEAKTAAPSADDPTRAARAAFAELDWRRPDVTALLVHRGLLVVREADCEAVEAWLRAHDYDVSSLDCSQGFRDLLRQMGELFRWMEQFGYRLEDGKGNLDAINDGFFVPSAPGRGAALRISGADELPEEQRSWFLGVLSIAMDHSLQELAVGRAVLILLPLAEGSPLVGRTVSTVAIPRPHALRLPSRP